MPHVTATAALSEQQFGALVEALSSDPTRRAELTDLLREDHPVYDQRSAASIVRMRGWILIALSHVGLTDTALLFVLEELDRIEITKLLVVGVLEEDLGEIFRHHANGGMPPARDHLAIQFDHQRLRHRRPTDAHKLVRFHADAVIDEHVGQFFQSRIPHGGGLYR